mmetsp:Transcript_19453/g.28971  ORF Transcript_19453/g.28971 Transcript_19453/m.28971 type:complete len:213 (+) Transcript_19453:320-958(+)
MKIAPLPQTSTISMSSIIQLSIRERRKRGSRSTLIRTGTRNTYTTTTTITTALSSRLVRMIVLMTTIGMVPVCVWNIFLLQITLIMSLTTSRSTIIETTTTTIGIIAHRNRFIHTTTTSGGSILNLFTSMSMILMSMLASNMTHYMSCIRRTTLTSTGMSMRLTLMIGPLMQRMGMRHVMMFVRFMTVVGMIVLRTATLASIVTVMGMSVFV